MKQRTSAIASCLLAAAATVLVASPSAAATWTVVPAQAVGTSSLLNGVDAVSATDGWAVGGSGNGLVERWNGSAWSVVPSPNLLDPADPLAYATLGGVDALSATDAFAVGRSSSFGAIAERWNGTRWSRMTLPAVAGGSLTAVKAFSGSNVIAVGEAKPTSRSRTLALRWNGSTWTEVASPSPGTRNNVLNAVDGASADRVWAVGYVRNLPYGNRTRQSLVLRWNGSAWSHVPSPAAGQTTTVLNDVAAVSATDAWAVGYAQNLGGNAFAAVLRWNGTAWNVAPAPPLATLTGVTALSPANVWVTGTDGEGLPQLANWRGSGWTVQPAPAGSGPGSPYLTATASVGTSTVWAVGYSHDGTTGQARPMAIRTTNG